MWPIEGGMRDRRDALWAAVEVEVVGRDGNDLPEAQGDDGQIVAAQPQDRGTEDQAGQGRDGDAERQHEPEVPVVPGGRAAPAVAPDGVERHVAQVQHAGLADDHVEADGQEDEDADVLREHVRPGALRAP